MGLLRGLRDRVINEALADSPRGLLIEHGVHQGDPSRAAPGLCLGGANLRRRNHSNIVLIRLQHLASTPIKEHCGYLTRIRLTQSETRWCPIDQSETWPVSVLTPELGDWTLPIAMVQRLSVKSWAGTMQEYWVSKSGYSPERCRPSVWLDQIDDKLC